MSYINYTAKEVNVKVVYYGAGLSGKTTNLQYIYDRTTPDVRSAITTVNLQTDKMLSFNFLPLALGEINGFKVRFHLYTLSGQVFYASSSKTVLKGLDGVCFIGDSQIERMEANLESLKSLNSNLMEMGLDPIKFPRVVQYNKRDRPSAVPFSEIAPVLNPTKVPEYEAVAPNGVGVFDTFKTIAKLVMAQLQSPA